jgi:hypothetical protein
MPKRKATAAQLRNLAKGRKKLAAMRRAGTVGKKRATRPTRRNPCVPAAHRNPRAGVYSTVRLAAPNDSNGNPRRLFLAMKGGEPVGVFDEGYEGKAAIPDQKMRDGWQGITIAVPASEYREWLKTYRALGMTGSVKKRNPAYGNFMTARNVLRTGRTTNPKPRAPGTPAPRLHWVVASADPKAKPSGSRIQWWTGKDWANSYRQAAEFSDSKNASYVARKMCNRKCAVVKYGTHDNVVADALR